MRIVTIQQHEQQLQQQQQKQILKPKRKSSSAADMDSPDIDILALPGAEELEDTRKPQQHGRSTTHATNSSYDKTKSNASVIDPYTSSTTSTAVNKSYYCK